MKIRTEYVKTSYIVNKLAEKYGLNKTYLWDKVEENFNHIKGLNTMMSQKEIDVLEEICKNAMD